MASNPTNSLTPQQPQGMANSGTASSLDPTIVNLAKAIRDVESGGNFQARGKSGEFGAYQFTQPTWDSVAPRVLGRQVAFDQASELEQNAVAYHYIKELKDKGNNAGQIASIWNSGRADPNGIVGVNDAGVAYDTPSYVNNVYAKYLEYKGGGTQQPEGLPTYGALFPASDSDSPVVAGFKALGNLPSSMWGLGAALFDIVTHPVETVQGLSRAAVGGYQKLTGDEDTADVESQTFDAFAKALKDRYGSLEALQNTATNDPFGFGADVAGILFGGASAVGRGAEAGQIASRVARGVTEPIGRAAEGVAGAPFRLLGRPDLEALGASERTGIRLPAGAYSSSPFIQGAETLALAGVGNERMVARVAQATDQMDALARTIVESTKGADDLAEAGQAIAKGLEKFDAQFRKTTGALYDELQKTAGDLGAQTGNTIRILDDIITRKEAIADTGNLKFFKDKLAVATGGKGDVEFVPLTTKGKETLVPKAKQYPAPTFSTLKNLRTNVGELIDSKFLDPFVKQHYGQLKQLYGALSRDMEATIKATRNKDLIRLYADINKRYAAGRQIIQSQFARNIKRLADQGKYSNIINALIKPSTAIEDIPRIMAVIGEQGANNLRAGFLKKVIEGARNAEGDFTAQGINRQIKKYGEDKVGAILTPEQYQGLKDLGKLTAALEKVSKQFKGSQTAFILKNLAELGAIGSGVLSILTGNFVLGMKLIGGVIGTEAASYLFASNMGQKILLWGATRGTEFANTARAMGIKPPPDEGTIGGNGNAGIPRDGSPGGGVPPGGAGTPSSTLTPERVPGVQPKARPVGQGMEQGRRPAQDGAAIPRGASQPESQISPTGGSVADGATPLTSPFQAKTVMGRIKEAVQNYLENVRPGLVVEDVTQGNQQFNIGLSSVKGRVAGAMDDLVSEGDELVKAGKFEDAQRKYNDALAAGTNVLSQAFEGSGIKIKPRGVGIGIYGKSVEPNYDAVAVVPRGKEDLFHYILADVADNRFHQYSMLTYRYAPKDAQPGVVDAVRGISNEPFLRVKLEQPLTAKQVGEITDAAEQAGIGGLSLREGGKSIDIINLTKYNDDYETFISNATKFRELLNERGITGAPEFGVSETRFVGSDPDAGHGFSSYSTVRDAFRKENPAFFNPEGTEVTSKVIERLKNKELVSRQEIEQLVRQQDISPMERSVVLDALSDVEKSGMKKVPTADLVARIEGKSLPVSMYETDSYANYGLREVGLGTKYADDGASNAKTLVFETPVEHGSQGHFSNPKHFGHVRVYIDEVDGKKVGYITELQSDVFQKADLEAGIIGYDKIAQAKKDALEASGWNKRFEESRRRKESEREALPPGGRSREAFDAIENKYREEYDSLESERAEILAEAERKVAEEGLSPLAQQLINQGKNDRYVDTLLRGTLQYFEKQGVKDVRVATPSSVAKIEGYVNSDDIAPYSIRGERARNTMDDLDVGETIEYLGEDYMVVDTRGELITVAPSDKVQNFRFSQFVEDEANSLWDEALYDIQKGVGKKIGDPGDTITAEWAQKAKETGVDDYRLERILDEIDEDNPLSLDELEEMFKRKVAEETDFSQLEDIYGRDKVFSHEIGKGYDSEIYVITDGDVETLGQPSSFAGGLDEGELNLIDPGSDYAASNVKAAIAENFNDTYAGVLNGYVDLYNRNLQKLAKEQNVPIKYVDGNYDATWYEFPLTKVKRYLFGS